MAERISFDGGGLVSGESATSHVTGHPSSSSDSGEKLCFNYSFVNFRGQMLKRPELIISVL